MRRPRPRRDVNVTLRVDDDSLMWARTRALFAGTSVNALIRRFIDEYGAVPDRFRAGEPPPWHEPESPGAGMREVTDPVRAVAEIRAREHRELEEG